MHSTFLYEFNLYKTNINKLRLETHIRNFGVNFLHDD